MTHFFVQHCIRDGGYALEKLFYHQIFTYVHIDGKSMIVLGTVFWKGDLACVVMLVCVIAVSWLTHRFVEVPGQVWFRCMVTKYSKPVVLPDAQSKPAAAALLAD
jgi:peptidoglycan/LPS O-acetylase OafA/YrhL